MATAAKKLHVIRDRAESRPRLRFVTATSLFDGHDASINVIRRILQASGVEVIHLGHNRSVREIVTAAVHEDANGIAVSSYQGGHVEFFKYAIDMLKHFERSDIKLFGGGGGVIVADEIQELHEYGVARIYSPADGQDLGLQGMIDDMIEVCSASQAGAQSSAVKDLDKDSFRDLAMLISSIESGESPSKRPAWKKSRKHQSIPVLGITGTGGSGKSSLTDELILRIQNYCDAEPAIAVLAVDPTRKKTGGALLGDRIRMNSLDSETVFFRSVATRQAGGGIPQYMNAIVDACRLWNFDLIIVETPGIGQGDTEIIEFVDKTIYVMTPDYGAASQLEKIDMLDYADIVAINKYDSKGAEDAYRDVCKQVQRNREAFDHSVESMPVFGTISSRFNDDGVTSLFCAVADLFGSFDIDKSGFKRPHGKVSSQIANAIPASRSGYLAQIAAAVRGYREKVQRQASVARQMQQLRAVQEMLNESHLSGDAAIDSIIEQKKLLLDDDSVQLLGDWEEVKRLHSDHEIKQNEGSAQLPRTTHTETISGTRIPKLALPKFSDDGDLLQWLMLENLPGSFPYTGGVFAYRREDEDPTRMFAGEGGPDRTNRRFKLLSQHSEAKRLSTAFDSVSLYGFNPDKRPDIYGKVGNSGVSIATLDDMKALYAGFDLCSPRTSVSMTINGPAPAYLALLLNTAIDQQTEVFEQRHNRQPDEDEYEKIRSYALSNVRGTVQADILKEDQGQNTCIFSTEFSLKVMGDIQEYFIEHDVQKFYSVSISGYHIAEAGANPISQLAFTLSNAFTYVEMYLARGMDIDDFAPNLSFFFSNGLDAEYTVMGRVARRIWAVTLREKYGANSKSQRLKYHIQTSGRSLHAQEIDFNDIRTTLQALIAVYDNCNSLHTNAYDEAITTPTEESVRRAMAVQLIINKEWGLAKVGNSNQGSFILEELTDLVEEAVLCEFESISKRDGVLGAMETGYQRGRIQEQSLYYERMKHDGSLPIVGVNMFLNDQAQRLPTVELARSTDQEKSSQLQRLESFHERNSAESSESLKALKQAVLENRNVFEHLMSSARVCSVGQITSALFEVGGKYRRNM